MVVFIVLVLAWGTARYSILYHRYYENIFMSEESANVIFKKMLIAPVFQIFGELFITSEEEALSASMVNFFFFHFVQYKIGGFQCFVIADYTR